MSLFNELKRRNVFKVAIAYVVMSWLVLQVADVVLNHITAPGWIFQVLMLFLAIGLPFAIFFAWAFELTPEGLKRESEVDRTQSITPQTGKKLNLMITVVLLLALGYFAVDKFVLSSGRDAALVEATEQATTQAITAQTAEAVQTVDADKSIAVLPFVDMSPDKDQEYMSDGLAEELLNLLAKIPQLRVIARTSSFAFKGEKIEIAEIAKKLNVAHVLEGSVRKSGNQVRITAQLIRASDSSHLWSETYDRSLDDVFAIQDEISAAVVEQLKITLLGAAPKARETDPKAYALFLQARQLSHQLTPAAAGQSILLNEQVLAIDPGYAAAWVGLAQNYTFQASNGLRPIGEGYPLAREAANKALAIDADNALAFNMLGVFAMEYDNDLVAAAGYDEQALALEPTNPDVLVEASRLLRALGRLEDAIALLQYVVARDPVNPRAHYNLGILYLYTGRLGESIASFQTTQSLSPGYASALSSMGYALLLQGDAEAALLAVQQDPSIWKQIVLPMVYHALGRTAESDAALAELIDKYEKDAAYNIAYVLAYRSEADRAFEWLGKAVQYKDPGLTDVAFTPEFSNIHDDPRWLPFLESIGRSPAQLDAIKFKVTLPE